MRFDATFGRSPMGRRSAWGRQPGYRPDARGRTSRSPVAGSAGDGYGRPRMAQPL